MWGNDRVEHDDAESKAEIEFTRVPEEGQNESKEGEKNSQPEPKDRSEHVYVGVLRVDVVIEDALGV